MTADIVVYCAVYSKGYVDPKLSCIAGRFRPKKCNIYIYIFWDDKNNKNPKLKYYLEFYFLKHTSNIYRVQMPSKNVVVQFSDL